MAASEEEGTRVLPQEKDVDQDSLHKDDSDQAKDAEKFVINLGTRTDDIDSLQDAFLKYKRLRQNEIKRAKKVKRREVPNETRLRALADSDRMWQLRMKFLEQAKKYFGAPYAKKYWKPEDPEYKSRYFLDCCGLVRRVMLDLRFDFGFKLGPWNQSYMYDTLPITLEEKDMKPGDLVFISAIYYSPKAKKQKHDLTHVEIWLGEGPKTIGSRWHKGHVQVFDSYSFKPQAYHSEAYHFKSIDTWLMGICRSHCPEHDWRMRGERFKPCKKSVFSLQKGKKKTVAPPVAAEEEEEEGESAGEDFVQDEPEGKLDPEHDQAKNIAVESSTSKQQEGEIVKEGESGNHGDQIKLSAKENEDLDLQTNREEIEEENSIIKEVSEAFVEGKKQEVENATGQDLERADSEEEYEGEDVESTTESGSEETVDEESEDITARGLPKNAKLAGVKGTRPKTSPCILSSRKTTERNRDCEVRGEKLILHSRSEDYFANLALNLPPPSKSKRENTFQSLTEDELDRLTIGKRPVSVPSNMRLGVESKNRSAGEKPLFLTECIPEVSSVSSNEGENARSGTEVQSEQEAVTSSKSPDPMLFSKSSDPVEPSKSPDRVPQLLPAFDKIPDLASEPDDLETLSLEEKKDVHDPDLEKKNVHDLDPDLGDEKGNGASV